MHISLKNHYIAEYFKYYINLINDEAEFIEALEFTHKKTNEILDFITEENGAYAYAEGKWSVKELLTHLIDTERIFCTRALAFARGDKTNLPGFDHDDYVRNSNANNRKLSEIAEEFQLVRNATIALFKGFSEEMLNLGGTANNNELTVLGIGYIIAGHETHHIHVLQEKYLD